MVGNVQSSFTPVPADNRYQTRIQFISWIVSKLRTAMLMF
jgi:hypothetical protein